MGLTEGQLVEITRRIQEFNALSNQIRDNRMMVMHPAMYREALRIMQHRDRVKEMKKTWYGKRFWRRARWMKR